jgi:hypothetical protein
MSKTKEKPKNKRGRPPALQPDEETMRTLKACGQIHCTTKETAAVLGVSEPTLIAFFKRHEKARETFENGKANGRASLRRMQFRSAENGNTSMLIWLGKQHLGQSEKHQHGGDPNQPIEHRHNVQFTIVDPNHPDD